MKRIRTGASALACCALAAAAVATPGHAAFPGQNGKIAFERADACGFTDIWVMDPDGSDQTQLTDSCAAERNPVWSADGTQIAFTRDDPDGLHVYTMGADGSGVDPVTSGVVLDREPAWSPDGTRIAFTRQDPSEEEGPRQLQTVKTDGTGIQTLTTGTAVIEPDWSPDGTQIAYSEFNGSNWDLFLISPSGGSPVALTTSPRHDEDPDWSPDGGFLVYESFSGGDSALYVIERDGSPSGQPLAYPSPGFDPVWSPDGSRMVVSGIWTTSEIGSNPLRLTNEPEPDVRPDWQPVPPAPAHAGYPRPKGATPVKVHLVPAFEPCTTPNRTHGPPLAFPSCSPPTQASDYLTVGTADSNGQPTRSIATVRFDVQAGNPATPADEADVALSAEVTDIRCAGTSGGCSAAPADYTGELQGTVSLRITDRAGGHAHDVPVTVSDQLVSFGIPCAATSDLATGATCQIATTLDAVVPGIVSERTRAIWELGQIRLLDGGADGAAGSDDNTLFAVQGVFIP